MPRSKEPLPIVVRMSARLDALEARARDAMQAAANQLVKNYGGVPGGQSRIEREIGLSQPILSGWCRGRGLGVRALYGLAEAWDLDIAKLVEDFVDEKTGKAKVLPFPKTMQIEAYLLEGWAEAVTEARRRWTLPDWAWRAAGAVVLPARPRELPATPALARDLARLCDDHCEGTRVLVRGRRKAES